MTSQNTVADRIRQANQGRRADQLLLKYTAMRQTAFRFFRATPSLFYADWLHENAFQHQPFAWVCGDLHVENMGAFKAENGQVYFDINDFDESLLAPCTVDLARLVTSLFVAAPDLHRTPDEARQLARHLVADYAKTLQSGHSRAVDRNTANGVLKTFLDQVGNRTERDLLNRYTTGKGTNRRLQPDGLRLLALPPDEQTRVRAWLDPVFRAQTGARLLDVVFRLAGTSSLGLNRYIALVETDADKRRLIDVKAVRSSVALPYFADVQPNWHDEATRVVTLQQRLQDISPGGLRALTAPDQEPFVLRNVQPQADRIDLTTKRVQTEGRLRDFLGTVAQLTASAHLRGTGQQGAAPATALIAFGQQTGWQAPLLHRAEAYADQVRRDYTDFCALPATALLAGS